MYLIWQYNVFFQISLWFSWVVYLVVFRNMLTGTQQREFLTLKHFAGIWHWGAIPIIIPSIYTSQQPRDYFFLSILLIMALTSTGAEAAAALAFSSSSCCQRIMGFMPGFRFLAFCSSWAGLRREGHIYYISFRNTLKLLYLQDSPASTHKYHFHFITVMVTKSYTRISSCKNSS